MIKAFVGHSFKPEDGRTIDAFIKVFNSLKASLPFEWDHAKSSQIKPLSKKVPQKMEEKNLFIGIFTKTHIEVKEKDLINSKFFHKGKYISRKRDCEYGTSYWITQESGYAIAYGMKTLFLIEKGVRELKGLHADMEHISFERGRESDCFTQLNEALADFAKEIEDKSEKGGSVSPPKEPKKEVDKASGENISVKEVVKAGKVKADEQKEEKDDVYYFREIYMALSRKENPKFEILKREVFEKYKNNDDETIEWQAKILYLEGLLIHKDIFNDLIDLQKNKPDNSLLAYYVGSECEKYKNYPRAIEEYLKSAKFETRKNSRLHRISLASGACVKNNQEDKAIDLLLRELHKDLPAGEEYLIYLYLSDIAKSLKKDDLFTAFSEKALMLNPSNNTLRFNLAYKYSNVDKDGLALYHYNILAENNPDSLNLNNLGVAYAELGMPGKAVKSYIKASKLGSTLSRANLAQKLLNEGFIGYADEQLKEAMKAGDYEKDNVGRALSRIDSIQEEEVKKEEQALRDIAEERQFKLDYAEAYSIGFVTHDTISGSWNSRHGKVEINLESGNLLKGRKEEIIEESSSILGRVLAAGAGYGTLPENRRIKYIRTFDGNIVKNRIIDYKIKIEKQSLGTTLLTRDTKTSEFSGYGIIDKAMNVIKMLEVDKDKKQTIYELKRGTY